MTDIPNESMTSMFDKLSDRIKMQRTPRKNNCVM